MRNPKTLFRLMSLYIQCEYNLYKLGLQPQPVADEAYTELDSDIKSLASFLTKEGFRPDIEKYILECKDRREQVRVLNKAIYEDLADNLRFTRN
jgi:hypothetical protein